MQIGIIGAGRFGKLLQKHLATDNEVTMDHPANCELVIFAVPNHALEAAIQQWQPQIDKGATIIDVGSVKELPSQLLLKYFQNNIIGVHPLFGPDSAAQSWEGHTAVFCKLHTDAPRYEAVKQLFTSRGVMVFECTPEEHDLLMANTQALVHFIGRALSGSEAQAVATPDYQNLLNMMSKVTNDTWELFFDMQTLNPQAAAVRATFVQKLLNLQREITEHDIVQATELVELRKHIDRVDEQIVTLIGERFAIARQIGKLKKAEITEVHDATREANLFIRLHNLAMQHQVPLEVVTHVYDYLMGESRKVQAANSVDN